MQHHVIVIVVLEYCLHLILVHQTWVEHSFVQVLVVQAQVVAERNAGLVHHDVLGEAELRKHVQAIALIEII